MHFFLRFCFFPLFSIFSRFLARFWKLWFRRLFFAFFHCFASSCALLETMVSSERGYAVGRPKKHFHYPERGYDVGKSKSARSGQAQRNAVEFWTDSAAGVHAMLQKHRAPKGNTMFCQHFGGFQRQESTRCSKNIVFQSLHDVLSSSV